MFLDFIDKPFLPTIFTTMTFTAEVACSFFGLAYRNRKPFTLSLQTTLLPLLRRTTTHSRSLTFPLRPSRRFFVTSATTAPPQSEDSDVSTVIPPDNRIPATIITGFLGSGKVSISISPFFLIQRKFAAEMFFSLH